MRTQCVEPLDVKHISKYFCMRNRSKMNQSLSTSYVGKAGVYLNYSFRNVGPEATETKSVTIVESVLNPWNYRLTDITLNYLEPG